MFILEEFFLRGRVTDIISNILITKQVSILVVQFQAV